MFANPPSPVKHTYIFCNLRDRLGYYAHFIFISILPQGVRCNKYIIEIRSDPRSDEPHPPQAGWLYPQKNYWLESGPPVFKWVILETVSCVGLTRRRDGCRAATIICICETFRKSPPLSDTKPSYPQSYCVCGGLVSLPPSAPAEMSGVIALASQSRFPKHLWQ